MRCSQKLEHAHFHTAMFDDGGVQTSRSTEGRHDEVHSFLVWLQRRAVAARTRIAFQTFSFGFVRHLRRGSCRIAWNVALGQHDGGHLDFAGVILILGLLLCVLGPATLGIAHRPDGIQLAVDAFKNQADLF